MSGDCLRAFGLGEAGDDNIDQPPQILDQGQAQRDRDGPQLSDLEGLDVLIGVNEPFQPVDVESTVGVGNEGPGNAVNPGIAGERSGNELGKLIVVIRGQILLDFANLLLDNVEIVQKPFPRGRDLIARLCRSGKCAEILDQLAGIFGKTAPERLPRRPGFAHELGRRQRTRMQLQPLGAEQFGANGRITMSTEF